MFAGFSVTAGNDRFGEHIKLGGEWNDCDNSIWIDRSFDLKARLFQ